MPKHEPVYVQLLDRSGKALEVDVVPLLSPFLAMVPEGSIKPETGMGVEKAEKLLATVFRSHQPFKIMRVCGRGFLGVSQCGSQGPNFNARDEKGTIIGFLCDVHAVEYRQALQSGGPSLVEPVPPVRPPAINE